MAREYGKNRNANLCVRVTEQEKEQLIRLAGDSSKALSQLLREIIKSYLMGAQDE